MPQGLALRESPAEALARRLTEGEPLERVEAFQRGHAFPIQGTEGRHRGVERIENLHSRIRPAQFQTTSSKSRNAFCSRF